VILKRACEISRLSPNGSRPFINRSRNVPQSGRESFSGEHNFVSAESLAADPTRIPARAAVSATKQIHCE
jgi:hypothetical protein